jgi:hypothetical protein
MATFRIEIEYHYAETFDVVAADLGEAITRARSNQGDTYNVEVLDGDDDILNAEEVSA